MGPRVIELQLEVARKPLVQRERKRVVIGVAYRFIDKDIKELWIHPVGGSSRKDRTSGGLSRGYFGVVDVMCHRDPRALGIEIANRHCGVVVQFPRERKDGVASIQVAEVGGQ